MATQKITIAEQERTRRAYERCKGNITHTADMLGIGRSTLQARLRNMGIMGDGTEPTPREELPKRVLYAEPGRTRVVLMTAAQDETPLFNGALQNLKAYAGHRQADILIGGFTYQKALFEENRVEYGSFHSDVKPLLAPEIIELAPKLIWYGRANILPTAVSPLAGWDTNTKDKWAIFPHAKIALKSIPVMPSRFGKQIMTTGVITKQNYIQRNAGQKAEFHHTPGAAIAEIKPDGTFFVRQLSMSSDGSFQDLDVMVKNGEISRGPQIESITWGDIHLEDIDPMAAKTCWGYDAERGACVSGGMVDDLKPKYQFFHDSYDFKARMHHTIDDPHKRAQRLQEGVNDVADMLFKTARFLRATKREDTKSVHIASNHNLFLERWLKDVQGHFDPVNALIWHKLNARWFEEIAEGNAETYCMHADALKNSTFNLEDVDFVKEGQSYLICQAAATVECGLHGHLGPRGARGSAAAFAKIVERVNYAHTHEPNITEAAYSAGTTSKLWMEYIKSPSAWQHAEIITYATGKRAIVTLQNGCYRG
jgi:hypothetical protein